MIETNFSLWTFREFLSFTVNLQKDENKAQQQLMKIVTGWDYDVAFSPSAIDELYPLEAAQVLHDAAIAINDEMAVLDVSVVTVDFKAAGWRNKRFKEFVEARNAQNAPKIESMLREVVRMDGFSPEDKRPMTFHEGARFVRAVMESYQNVLSGKV